MTLKQFEWLRRMLTRVRRMMLVRLLGMDIHPTAQLSLSARPDMTHPRGVHIGHHSMVAFDARILTHDRTRGLYVDTRIGANCFIGGGAIVLPGVTIGDNCIVGAGSVVTRDVPARTIVAGNPARVIARDIEVGAYGRLADSDIRARQTRHAMGGAQGTEPSGHNP